MESDTKKVAIIYRMNHPGGVQSVVLALIRGLNKVNIIPDIIWDQPPSRSLLDKAGCVAGFEPAKFTVPSPWIDKLPDTLRYLAWIFNVIRAEKYPWDYDFYYIFYNGFLHRPGTTNHLRYLNGPPILPQLEKYPSGIRGAGIHFFIWIYRLMFRHHYPAYEYHADSRYVANSQFISNLFEQTYYRKIPVIFPPIKIPEKRFIPDDFANRDTITYFSRIVPYKRPEMVLSLAARYPEYRCVVMGGVPKHRQPYLEKLKTLARGLNLRNLSFLANPTDEVVRRELNRTRFYIFPAQNEHFGMTTVEAIGHGAIPFVHDSGGQREIVPFEILRFSDESFYQRFSECASWPIKKLIQIRCDLYDHIQQFEESKSVTKLVAYLDGIADTQ